MRFGGRGRKHSHRAHEVDQDDSEDSGEDDLLSFEVAGNGDQPQDS